MSVFLEKRLGLWMLMDFLQDVVDEMRLLMAEGPPKPGDTWELSFGGFDSWAVLQCRNGLLLAVPVMIGHHGEGVQVDSYSYRNVKMPAISILPKKSCWVDPAIFMDGIRDGYLTPFMVKRLIGEV